MNLHRLPPILIRGAGEHASGTAHRLRQAGFRVVMTEIGEPRVVRRAVAFAQAVFADETSVCGVTAKFVAEIPADWDGAWIPVLIDSSCRSRDTLKPDVLIDARLKKRDIEMRATDAPLVIGLGPGFRAGLHAHVVIETNRGHNLGAIIREGEAEPNTGVPAEIAGHSHDRCFRAPQAGAWRSCRAIGEMIAAGEEIGRVDDTAVGAAIPGVLRGLLHPGLRVEEGEKLGDLDPRSRREACFTLSDKTRTISGGVLEAILHWYANR